jgi:hypothetical protein
MMDSKSRESVQILVAASSGLADGIPDHPESLRGLPTGIQVDSILHQSRQWDLWLPLPMGQ